MKNPIRHAIAVSAALALSAALAAPPWDAPIAAASDDGALATFEGEVIDLSEGWGEAEACYVEESGTTCYRSEDELDAAQGPIASRGGEASLLSSCSSTLRLYTLPSYGGNVLALSTQGQFLNLSAYGYDNVTSSYKVGACDSTFYSGSSGGGLVYPGNTSAFAQSSTMLTAWDNVVSSVYIS